MTILKNVGISVLLGLMIVMNSGCASYLSAKASQREIATKRIVASQNKEAVEALKMGVEPEVAIKAIKMENGAGIGVDLLSLEAITENPVRQVGAALVDAALGYGLYTLTQSGNDNTSSSKRTVNNININNASRTDITINQNDTTTTTTTTTTTDTQNDTQTDNHSGAGDNR